MTPKEMLLQAVQDWPQEIAWEEIVERIYLSRKIHRGLQDIESGRVVSQEEIERVFPVTGDHEQDHLDERGAA